MWGRRGRRSEAREKGEGIQLAGYRAEVRGSSGVRDAQVCTPRESANRKAGTTSTSVDTFIEAHKHVCTMDTLEQTPHKRTKLSRLAAHASR